MTLTHAYLPSIKKLKNDVEKKGANEVIQRYSCYEYLVGSTEAIDYLNEIYIKFKEDKK